ncbi:MAG: tyrosine-type recombinase/integrase [Treponema sp.]|jgi:integrase/recombinase XerC|nr:tyrosine-type recombinase/integrase [Treponema sp.]
MMKHNGPVAEYLSYLEAVRGVSGRTLAAYGKDLERFASYCKNSGFVPETAAAAGVERFIADLSAEGIAAVSVNRALSSIRGFYRWLIRFGRRKDDPSANIRNLKTPKALPAFLWEGEMAAFAELPEKEGILWPVRDKALILAMYSAGLRISELVSLAMPDIDPLFSGARVLGKGGKERFVFFSDEAAEAIREYLPARAVRLRVRAEKKDAGAVNGTGNPGKAQITDKLFISRRGRAISVPGVRWIINRYGDRSGLGKHVHPHALRHSFATHLVNSGCDVRIVQEMLGHASISTTQRYTHVDMEHLRRAYMKAHPHAQAAFSGDVQPPARRPRPERPRVRAGGVQRRKS